MKLRSILFLAALILFSATVSAQQNTRKLSGAIVTAKNEAVARATITVRASTSEQTAQSDAEGNFSINAPRENLTLRVTGKNIVEQELAVGANDNAENLRVEISYVIPKIHDGLVIAASQLDPTIDRRNDVIYRDTLFSRDDQVFHTLDAGINAGQHEGGGKSLEIRRFGYNLDHGGVNGGLKVLVDNFQQNRARKVTGKAIWGS